SGFIMNKEDEIPPLPFIIINNTECIVCKKSFKSSRGLFQHKNIIRKYNEIPARQEKIPSFLINKFKENIVYLIHRRLGKKNTGLQTVSMDCPVDLFKEIFKNYIHYYTKRTGALKCVFRGSTGYQELSNIFDDSNWGVKYYQQNQKTFVQLSSQNQEESPLSKLRLKKAIKNPKYSYGELIVEWKQKKDIDAKKNVHN
ncbi:225_t:CDS:1, partial [Rhizophagus irregularis]